MVEVQQGNDVGTVSAFVKPLTQLLQLAFGMFNLLNVPLPITSQDGIAKSLIHGIAMGKIIGFKHVGKKMDRSAVLFLRDQHCVHSLAVTGENLVNHWASGGFNVINE